MTDLGPGQRIVLAAAVSGAVHAAAIALGHLERPQSPADLPPLAVRIVNVPVAEAPVPASRRVERSPRRVARAPAPAVPLISAPSPIAAAEPDIAEAASAQEAPAETPPPMPERIVVATAPDSVAVVQTPPLPAFPRKGRITFSLVYGRDQFPVGRTVQTWEIEGNRYELASRSETTGLADILRSQHRSYSSRGELTHEGLRPETFVMSRNRGRGAEEARAQFDWAAGSVSLGPVTAQRQQTLPRGSQDLVSLMYQLAVDPPSPGRMRLPVTNGTKLETYVLEVLPEERIETPLGILRALPIRQVRTPGSESIELWLATEYRHLPVRIRFFNRDGEPAGEQVVTEIRLSDD